jgi:hypothetical protein
LAYIGVVSENLKELVGFVGFFDGLVANSRME